MNTVIIDSTKWMYYIRQAAIDHGIEQTKVYKAIEKDVFGDEKNRSNDLRMLIAIVKTATEMSIKDNLQVVPTKE